METKNKVPNVDEFTIRDLGDHRFIIRFINDPEHVFTSLHTQGWNYSSTVSMEDDGGIDYRPDTKMARYLNGLVARTIQ